MTQDDLETLKSLLKKREEAILTQYFKIENLEKEITELKNQIISLEMKEDKLEDLKRLEEEFGTFYNLKSYEEELVEFIQSKGLWEEWERRS